MAKKKTFQKVRLIFGDQLFPKETLQLSQRTLIFMAEDEGLCTHFQYHKHKLIFFLTAMREYADSLKADGCEVLYLKGDHPLFSKTYTDKLDWLFKEHAEIKEIELVEISDLFFKNQVIAWCEKNRLKLTIHPSPGFLTEPQRFSDYLSRSKRPFMMTFYTEQRKHLQILVDQEGEPQGGRWSFDTENRKKFPKGLQLPPPPRSLGSPQLESVQKFVDKRFADHPGKAENFWLPTTREQALAWLEEFVDFKLNSFGPFEDAIDPEHAFGFHSLLSPLMNVGLLTPGEVVAKVLETAHQRKVPLESVEGFVRQVIGWREFVKGIYDNYLDRMESENYWGHKRKLKTSWYEGTTGILPLDDSIGKVQTYGYTHHIERLMILSNLMLLSEIHPKQVHAWFMEMFVDSADWVMAANVYGMGQMSEGGIFATKPYICGSNYILKMSHYSKGPWCDTMDGLYWRFVDKHRGFFAKNPRMSMMVKMCDRLEAGRRKKLFAAAESFLKNHTEA